MKNLTYLLIIIFTFYACEKNEDDLIPSKELITVESFNTINGRISLTAQSAFIHWGDGHTTKMNSSSANKLTHFRHKYAVIGNYIITVKTNTLKDLFVGNIEYNNGLQSTYNVELGSCPNLSLLGCTYVNSIDVKLCPQLFMISVYGYHIPFNTKDCPQVKSFDINLTNGNGGSIPIPESTTSLNCSGIGIRSLYVSSKIETLDCSDNKLTSLDLSQCNKLFYVNCSNNQISSLSIPNQPNISKINCSNNKLSTEMLNSIFASLPVVSKGTINYSGNPGSTKCDFNIAKDKGWQ